MTAKSASNGEPVTLASPQEARALGIGMVFQHFSLFEEFTALENIAIPLAGRGGGQPLRETVRGQGARISASPSIWIARCTRSRPASASASRSCACLMQDPKLLILDEPTSVLTPQESEGLFTTLDKLAASGAGILFITTSWKRCAGLCTTATILRGGQVVADR